MHNKKGYAESDPTNDIEGIDSAHKLSLLSAICFGTKVNFDNIRYKGISNIRIEDINYSNKLGYKIKLISKSEIVNNKISSLVEPILINKNSQLANINSVLNAIKVETDHLESLFLIGEGAGGKATSSSVISDIFELASDVKIPSLGYKNSELTNIEHIDYNDRNTSFYLRITVKDIPGVLAKITSNLNEEGISIETILQMPENKINKNEVSIIITTHETNSNLLNRSLIKIENLNFVVSKIAVITIDKTIN
jgi:Homoserine dehydrogenase